MEENFNKHLGNKLKLRRLALGLTQTKVAKAINVTFQQIQKYEKGTNGVSSIRLLQLSNYLKVPINYFFEDFSEYLINIERSKKGTNFKANNFEIPIRDLIKKYGVGNRGFYSWLKKADGRRERYRQAQVRQAQMYAEECISIADATADAQEAQVSKLRIDARKFMASKLDPSVYGDQRAPLVNITVGSTHLNAIKDLATSPVTIEQVDDE